MNKNDINYRFVILPVETKVPKKLLLFFDDTMDMPTLVTAKTSYALNKSDFYMTYYYANSKNAEVYFINDPDGYAKLANSGEVSDDDTQAFVKNSKEHYVKINMDDLALASDICNTTVTKEMLEKLLKTGTL